MDRLDQLLLRPQQYSNIDGVQELGMGFMLLCTALFLWLTMHTPETFDWHVGYTLPVFFLATGLVMNLGVNTIKKHITYPRTGFVEYRTSCKTVRFWMAFAVAFTVAPLVSAGVFMAIKHHFPMSTLIPLYGLPLAAAYIRTARKMVWKWFVFLAMIAASFAIVLLPANLLVHLAGNTHVGSFISSQVLGAFWLTWVAFGTLVLISGGVTFALYLRRTHPPLPEQLPEEQE